MLLVSLLVVVVSVHRRYPLYSVEGWQLSMLESAPTVEEWRTLMAVIVRQTTSHVLLAVMPETETNTRSYTAG